MPTRRDKRPDDEPGGVFAATGTVDRRSGARSRAGDRRVDLEARKRVAQMSTEEMKRTLLTHELTGIRNRRAWEEAEKLPFQAAIDADSLKWFNDTLGHAAGDEVLCAIASALDAVTDQAYHIAGDEFVIQGFTLDEVHQTIQQVRHELQGVTIEVIRPDGTMIRKTGLEITHGIGTNRESAESALATAKRKREAAGVRPARGESPRAGLVWQLGRGRGR